MADWTRSILCIVLPFCLQLNGCATAFRGSTQSLKITSEPPGASVLVLPKDRWLVTPVTIKVDRVEAVTVLAEKPGYRSRIAYADPQADLASMLPSLGMIIFGIVPFIFAAWLDKETGATFALKPNPIHLILEPIPSETPTNDLPAPPPSPSRVDDPEVGLIRERVPVIDQEAGKIVEPQRDGPWSTSRLSKRMSIVCPLARHVPPCRQ